LAQIKTFHDAPVDQRAIQEVRFRDAGNGKYNVEIALNERGLAALTPELAKGKGLNGIEQNADKLTAGHYTISNVPAQHIPEVGEYVTKHGDLLKLNDPYLLHADREFSHLNRWQEYAVNALEGAKKSVHNEAEIKALHKTLPTSWKLKNMSLEALTMTGLIAFTAAVAAGELVKLVAGGKHTEKLEQQRVNAASQQASPFGKFS